MTKHTYIPRTTNYTLNPGDELNDLRMSDQVRPLYDHVKKFIRDTVEPFDIAGLNDSGRKNWHPVLAEDLLTNHAKLGVSAAEIDEILKRTNFYPPPEQS